MGVLQAHRARLFIEAMHGEVGAAARQEQVVQYRVPATEVGGEGGVRVSERAHMHVRVRSAVQHTPCAESRTGAVIADRSRRQAPRRREQLHAACTPHLATLPCAT